MNMAAETAKTRHEQLAWMLVGGGYPVVALAGIGSLLIGRESAPGPGVGPVIGFSLVLGGLGLLILSAAGSLIAVWALWTRSIRSRPAIVALLVLGAIGVALPGTFLIAAWLRGQ